MELIRAFFTNAGPGGFVVLTVVVILLGVYGFTLNWIVRGKEDSQRQRNTR